MLCTGAACTAAQCFKCLGLSCPPMLDYYQCRDCVTRQVMTESSGNIVAGGHVRARIYAEQIADCQMFLRDMAKAQKTLSGHSGVVARMRVWASTELGLHAPPFTGNMITYWILGRMTWVKVTTIERDVGTIRLWFKEAARMGVPRETRGGTSDGNIWTSQEEAEIAMALQVARRWGWQGTSNVKTAISLDAWLAYMDRTEQETQWKIRMYRFTAMLLMISFVRRGALALTKYARVDATNTSPDADASALSVDQTTHGSASAALAMVLHVDREKNQSQRITTMRYFSDDNCLLRPDGTSYPIATKLVEELKCLDMPSGFLLRSTKNSKTGVDSRYWGNFLTHFATTTNILRQDIGCQSFRRGYAIILTEIGGLTIDQVQTVGFWWSTAAKVYAGGARNLRIDLQRSPARRLAIATRLAPQDVVSPTKQPRYRNKDDMR
jgi:hypothetical protein